MSSEFLPHMFRIVIGDSSGDGHGQSQDYWYQSNKPIKDIDMAYRKAKKLHPKVCPEDICSEYEENHIEPEVFEILQRMGAPLPEWDQKVEPEGPWVSSDNMADLTAWFIGLGDPDLHIRLNEPPPRLNAGFIGYGTLGF